MMGKMGFSPQWVTWKVMCMEFVNYSVIVNSDRIGKTTPGRGLRQGDPLSPYVFLICAKGITTLLKKNEAGGDIHGIKVYRGAPILSHLLFADHCFLFSRATPTEASHIKKILSTYEVASIQSINMQKTKIYFAGIHQIKCVTQFALCVS